jgi:hypothetical protein
MTQLRCNRSGKENQMPLLDIEKEDFVDFVHGSVPTGNLPEYYDEGKDKVNLILLTVMTWANEESRTTGKRLYMNFRYIANGMKMAYQDQLISQKQREYLKGLSFEQLLELVWQTTQDLRLNLDNREISTYLREHLPS